ncbi:uncharacterized protein SAPINGB_P002197 [Magnusiomyces paraingens]|uniref:Uncharacterized protein n=1 Tax=Magnusiomyces paraingens TaxID=2606893 RepID=A0A5E8BIB3_9ASCO|nr:uncharacterized protein SAPINGB_P002197 [Saprochaete ingens]VVT49289.1 unnamed protein product [Saprochaete ingens]
MSFLATPSDFSYVLAALSTVPFVNMYIDISVGKLRKRAGVPYPALFASEEEAAKDPLKKQFNCAQKASMNFSEHVGSFLAAALVSGYHAPKLSAALVIAWSLGRAIYHHGYSSGDPKKRMRGGFATLSFAILMLTGAFYSVKSLL